MEWEPDALQPDDEHELQSAARNAGQKAAGVSRSKRADLEETQAEQGIFDMQFDPDEGH